MRPSLCCFAASVYARFAHLALYEKWGEGEVEDVGCVENGREYFVKMDIDEIGLGL